MTDIIKTGLLCRGGGGGGGGVWFPAQNSAICMSKGVKIYSTNQWTRINSYEILLADWMC